MNLLLQINEIAVLTGNQLLIGGLIIGGLVGILIGQSTRSSTNEENMSTKEFEELQFEISNLENKLRDAAATIEGYKLSEEQWRKYAMQLETSIQQKNQ